MSTQSACPLYIFVRATSPTTFALFDFESKLILASNWASPGTVMMLTRKFLMPDLMSCSDWVSFSTLSTAFSLSVVQFSFCFPKRDIILSVMTVPRYLSNPGESSAGEKPEQRQYSAGICASSQVRSSGISLKRLIARSPRFPLGPTTPWKFRRSCMVA